MYVAVSFWIINKTPEGGGFISIVMKIQLLHKFEDIISLENLLEAWKEFVKGKRQKRDVQEFALNLMDNILSLHYDLVNHIYQHGGYQAFNICDPKPRRIHKASVRDRLLHHAIHRKLYLFFEKIFIADSFSSRENKGTHKAINRFRSLAYQVSKNNTKTCWVLKCDIKKFFASIDQNILIDILKSYIPDTEIMWLLEKVIHSFSTLKLDIGLPLGNLTSQLFVNIYMNQFDQFVKHRLKIKNYIRYADDFIALSSMRAPLIGSTSSPQVGLISRIDAFLKNNLKLFLHPDKLFIKTLASGVDFLGWIHFPDHRILRTATKRRMLRRIQRHLTPETFNSYLGLLKHGNTFKIVGKVTELSRCYN
ncbi:MAG: hypothetical protein A3A16_03110 [Candidatus Harrisonbacteria bacterium RIFCSPLOWO2_01_FULL_44_18]|uniref:Reverse transcriptase domain-containing protein n=1 Tax=Candidatus Harrisonbacteria bacterium RIFCSPLOWO2_01_FULL_44_18 TaxID=1798407 RepID=A0A1G1ZL86_9BACT|nr:MAG: hypothetical protein A3A16_03110 [Candidatus Harrisonbacteria bacterium RIFCSPLOWO2_01_FULL_44_18]